jgi:Ca-activated chloride channel family protein
MTTATDTSHCGRNAGRALRRSIRRPSPAAPLGAAVVVPLLLVFALAHGAAAAPTEAAALMRLDDVGRGELLLRTDEAGLYRPAPILATTVRIKVSGMVARVVLRQQFRNPSEDWLEGRYVFPLSEEGAVDRMRLIVGERVIEGRIAERAEAKRRYEAAKQAGQRASLVEQERPNIFTTSVANIGPGETVTVEIAYRESLPFRDGRFSLRFPMVVGPRYIPGPAQVARIGGGGWALGAPVPDAERITPPLHHPDLGPINPVTIAVELDAGFPVAGVDSPFHSVRVDKEADGRFTVSLAEGAVPADRDFVLEWTPETGRDPAAALFAEDLDGDTYLLVMVMPPSPAAGEDDRLPRETVFVIDTSGSMDGTSIGQAREALSLALERLSARDRFNVIRFSNDTQALFPEARPADAANLDRAKRFVRGLRARGGTEMLPALRLALDGGNDSGRVRQVVFLTDGAVGNEAQLFDEITRRLGDSRLFTIGIGSAPNGYFMRKAAQFGRGSFTFIGEIDQVAEKMAALFAKLERPAMTDLRLSWSEGAEMESWPVRLPDLYDGEPVVATARLPRATGVVTVGGLIAGRRWQTVFPLDELAGGMAPAAGVAALWAADKVAALVDRLHQGADPNQVRAQVLEVALKHALVTRYTSLVAVDVTPARPEDAPLASGEVPTNLPHGWTLEGLLGLPAPTDQDAPAGPALPRTRRAAVQPAAAPPVVIAQGAATRRLDLPQTATPAPLHAAIGATALALALVLAWLAWRRPGLGRGPVG